jgi:D-methionine transport system substrate-binding protein
MKGLFKNKFVLLALALALVAGIFAGCGDKDKSDDSSTSTDKKENVTLKIGASPAPHAEILKQVVSDLAAEGITLEIVEFDDYVIPNTALDSGELQANYFQHQPYLDQFNAENGTNIVSAASIHYEPFGLYGGKTKTLDDLKDGAQVAVPNDATNEARALLLLQDLGLIKLKDGVGLEATKKDIEVNDKKLDIVEIEAAQLPKSLADVDFAVINGNYAIEAGLNAATDALAVEAKESLAATTFANIIAVNAGDTEKPEIQALVKALQSEKIRKFIEDTYSGAVVPTF